MAALATHSPRPVMCGFLYPRACRLTGRTQPTQRASQSSTQVFNAPHGNGAGRLISRSPTASSFCRSFSHSSQPRARDPTARAQSEFSRHNAKMGGREASMNVAAKAEMKKTITRMGATLDMGILPGTLVMPNSATAGNSTNPTGQGLPSFFSTGRWRLEYTRAKQRVQELLSLVTYKFFLAKKQKGQARPVIDFAGVSDVARRLHHDMWTAFANGDEATLRRVCASGLRDNLMSRMSRRGTAEQSAWTLHYYIGRPKVVSNRAAALPDAEGLALRQIVVRIKSRQSLETTTSATAAKNRVKRTNNTKAGGNTTTAEPQQRDVQEYLVIQRLLADNQESDWVIWGTTSESDVAPIAAGVA